MFVQWQTYWSVLRDGHLYRYKQKIAEDAFSKYERPASEPLDLTHLQTCHVTSATATVVGEDGKPVPKNMYVYKKNGFG